MMYRFLNRYWLALSWRGAFASLLCVAAVLICADPGHAQSKSEDKAYLQAGIKSLADGKADKAIEQISRALRSGKLSDADVAMALFQRGQAYRQAKKEGLAIADLTNALYLKALGDKDAEQAHLERARAFSALGMQPYSSADIQAASRAAGADAAAPAKPSAPQNTASLRGSTASKETDAPAAADNADWSASIDNTPPAGAVAQAPKSQPQSFNPVASVTNFFQNLIPGSGSQSTAPQQAAPAPPAPAAVQDAPAAPAASAAPVQQPVQTAQSRPAWQADPSDTQPQRPVWMADPSSSGASNSGEQEVVADWSGATQVKATPAKAVVSTPPPPVRRPSAAPVIVGRVTPLRPSNPAPVARAKQVAPPVRAAAPVSAAPQPQQAAKRYHLQLAAVSSQDEASQVWRQLTAKHANLLSGLTPTIKKTSGASGTYFRVGLGPFSSKTSTGRICDSFKQQGLDCRVVAQ